MLRGQLFARKTVDQCIADSEVGGGMRRTLGPVQLTALGIGAIIGAGIFAAIGTAITGDAGHVGAGSAIVVSIVLAGVTSALAAIGRLVAPVATSSAISAPTPGPSWKPWAQKPNWW